MKQQDLSVQTREFSGKGASRKLRQAGKIPAVFYGGKAGAINLEISSKELNTILSDSGRSTFLKLNSENGEINGKMAVIKELQANPINDNLIHADLFELSMDKRMRGLVPVRLTGKAAGVEMGGTLQPIRRELEVECLPKDMPDVIEIDVTELVIGDSIHIDEVQMPPGVEAPHDVNFTVAVLLAKKVVVEEEVEAEVEGEGEGEVKAEGEAPAEAAE